MPPEIPGLETISTYGSFLDFIVIYFTVLIIGNIASFSGFWLAFFGHLGPVGTFYTVITVLAANLTTDFGFYALGRNLHNTRLGKYLKNKFSHSKKIQKYFESGGLRWIFLAKFMQSTNTPIVFLAGWSNIPFKKFLKTSLAATLIWFVIILGIIYILGSGVSPLRTVGLFRKFGTTIAMSVVFFLVLNVLIHYLVKKDFIERGIQKIAGFFSNNRNNRPLDKQ